jgi:lipid A ethanolaminephosphotransferase
MGSHGPAYYKRYPAAFEWFTPSCQSSQLSDCTPGEINNSYDNTIAYTDHFLGEVIKLLDANDDRFETAMMYVGDHGESLGENGVYLHGLPYWMAPKEQTRVPMIFWFGSNNDDVDSAAMRALKDRPQSHDVVFHTLLSLFEVTSEVYRPELDLLHKSRIEPVSEN